MLNPDSGSPGKKTMQLHGRRLTVKKILAVGAMGMMLVAGGCGSSKKPTASNNVNDIAPPPPTATLAPSGQYLGSPMPSGYEQAKSVTPTPAADVSTPAAGKSYTVKKGDTLWSIAQRTYGDGKQYKKIVSANPSIKGDQLKAGQVITLP
jgi:5'-nucleotidase/UDP-sugar diphosphatase